MWSGAWLPFLTPCIVCRSKPTEEGLNGSVWLCSRGMVRVGAGLGVAADLLRDERLRAGARASVAGSAAAAAPALSRKPTLFEW